MVQMLLMNAGNELQLYVSPVNFKPDSPPVPISSPASFAGDLYKQIGAYRTLGWAEATWPLNEGRMDEKTFMDDLYSGLRRPRAGDPPPAGRARTGICSSA